MSTTAVSLERLFSHASAYTAGDLCQRQNLQKNKKWAQNHDHSDGAHETSTARSRCTTPDLNTGSPQGDGGIRREHDEQDEQEVRLRLQRKPDQQVDHRRENRGENHLNRDFSLQTSIAQPTTQARGRVRGRRPWPRSRGKSPDPEFFSWQKTTWRGVTKVNIRNSRQGVGIGIGYAPAG